MLPVLLPPSLPRPLRRGGPPGDGPEEVRGQAAPAAPAGRQPGLDAKGVEQEGGRAKGDAVSWLQ